mgnify:CR=1 FL=1
MRGVANAAPGFPEALERLAALWPKPRLLCGAAGEGERTAAEFFADTVWIEELLLAQMRITPGLDRKAQAAYLASYYATSIATVGAGLIVGFAIVPDFAPEKVWLGTDPARGDLAFQDISLRFAASPVMTSSGAALADIFRTQIEAHFAPLVTSLNRATALPPQALWRLVGDALGAAFLEAGQKFGAGEEAIRSALAVLKQRGSVLSNCQLHYFEVSVPNPGGGRQSRTVLARGGCCRLYTALGGALCANCVLQTPGARERLAEERLRREMESRP